MTPSRRRVVVTGVGVVTSLGCDLDSVFDALCRAESGIRPIRRFDVTHCPSKIGGIIENFAPTEIIRDRAGRLLLRAADWIQAMGLCSAELATVDAGIEPGSLDPERLGVYFGAGRGGAEAAEKLCALMLGTSGDWRRKTFGSPEDAHDEVARDIAAAIGRMPPTSVLQQCPGLVSAYVAMRWHARGPMMTNVNLCSAGAQAIGEAAWVIMRDDADVMIAGGSDSMLNLPELIGFCALEAVSARNHEGTGASKPFDLRRDGCVVGEGATALVLEELGHAQARGARIHAELCGYGASSDAHKVTAPPADGAGAVLAMRRAIAHAGLAPEDIDHVNAHGTSTLLNDRAETEAIKQVLGAHAYRIPVVSTKSMTGHLIAAAGALEAAIAVATVTRKRVPPTINLQVRDPLCDLDYAPEGARSLPRLRTVLSNSFALGGSNASLVFGEVT